MCNFFLFLFFIFQALHCIGKESGTLVVSFQTGPREERLDRVRFRLWNEQLEGQFYPKFFNHSESDNCQFRMVVIENLPVGRYSVQFLIPNADHFFEDVPERSFDLHTGEVVRINQLFRPREIAFRNSASSLSEL